MLRRFLKMWPRSLTCGWFFSVSASTTAVNRPRSRKWLWIVIQSGMIVALNSSSEMLVPTFQSNCARTPSIRRRRVGFLFRSTWIDVSSNATRLDCGKRVSLTTAAVSEFGNDSLRLVPRQIREIRRGHALRSDRQSHQPSGR